MPALDALDRSQINYRILKGAAICALADSWGMRIMGDIDIAVPSEQSHMSVSILQDLGFVPQYFRKVNKFDAPSASHWVNSDGYIVDLHVGDTHKVRTIVDAALASECAQITSQGRSWPIPSETMLALHGAWHARKASASSDQIQAILDFALLLPNIDEQGLARQSHAFNVSKAVAEIQSALETVINRPLPRVKIRHIEGPFIALQNCVDYLQNRKQSIFERSNHRRLPDGSFLRRVLYLSWLSVGHTRRFEFLVCRFLGGFISNEIFDSPLDRRRKLVPLPTFVGKPVDLVIICTDSYARMIFVNGKYFGDTHQTRVISIAACPKRIEVSARLLGDPPSQLLGSFAVQIQDASSA